MLIRLLFIFSIIKIESINFNGNALIRVCKGIEFTYSLNSILNILRLLMVLNFLT